MSFEIAQRIYDRMEHPDYRAPLSQDEDPIVEYEFHISECIDGDCRQIVSFDHLHEALLEWKRKGYDRAAEGRFILDIWAVVEVEPGIFQRVALADIIPENWCIDTARTIKEGRVYGEPIRN